MPLCLLLVWGLIACLAVLAQEVLALSLVLTKLSLGPGHLCLRVFQLQAQLLLGVRVWRVGVSPERLPDPKHP